MAGYHLGRRFEYKVRDHFTRLGYAVVRSAGSKTKADLVAMQAGVTLLIQCKRAGWPGPCEREKFARFCEIAGHPGIMVRDRDGIFEFRGITSKGEMSEIWLESIPSGNEPRRGGIGRGTGARTPPDPFS